MVSAAGPLLTVLLSDTVRDAFSTAVLHGGVAALQTHHSEQPDAFAAAAADSINATVPSELRAVLAGFFRTRGPDGPSALLLQNCGVDLARGCTATVTATVCHYHCRHCHCRAALLISCPVHPGSSRDRRACNHAPSKTM